MKRYPFFFSLLLILIIFSNQVLATYHSPNISVDETDELIKAISSSSQSLNESVSALTSRIREKVREIQALLTVLKQSIEQRRKLANEIREKKEELERKVKDLEAQIIKIQEQIKKLEAIQKKLEELIPKFAAITGKDQSLETSRRLFIALSKDNTKVAKLLEAIQNNDRNGATQIFVLAITAGTSASAGSSTGSGASTGGPAGATNSSTKPGITSDNISVAEINFNSEGGKILFRIGNLTHCLSTKKQCSGKSFSLIKSAIGNFQDEEKLTQSVKDLLTEINQNIRTNNSEIEKFLSDLKNTSEETGEVNQELAVELQKQMDDYNKKINSVSQITKKLDEVVEAILNNLQG